MRYGKDLRRNLVNVKLHVEVVVLNDLVGSTEEVVKKRNVVV